MSDPKDGGPSTKPPPYDPVRYARDVDARLEAEPPSRKPTGPPHPSHPALRDSCKDLRDMLPGLDADWDGELSSTPTLGAVAVLMVGGDELECLAPTESDRSLLGFVDGKLTVEEILAVSHVDVVTGVETFGRLARLGVVCFRRV